MEDWSSYPEGNWKMKGILRIITICSIIIGMYCPVFSQYNEAEIYYLRGENRLEEGIRNLNEFKQSLQNGFSRNVLKVGDIRKEFDKDRISLSSFLNILKRKYHGNNDEIFKKYYPMCYSESLCWDRIGRAFDGAKREFEKAIELDKKIVDAYLGKARACVGMGDYKEALPCFNMAINLIRKDKGVDIEKIKFTNSYKNEELFYDMADEVMKGRLTLSQDIGKRYDEWAKEIIEVLKNWRENEIDRKIKGLEKQIGVETSDRRKKLEREKDELIKAKVSNLFELTRFYSRHCKREEAEKEYEEAKKDMEGLQSWEYEEIEKEVKSGFEQLKEISFVINGELVKEFKNPVRIRFFNDRDYLSCDYLYLSFLPSGCFVEFKDEVLVDFSGNNKLFVERQANLTCEITFPQIKIKEEDRLPFYLTIDKDMPFHPLTENAKEFLRGYTSFEITFAGKDRRKYPWEGEEYRLVKDENSEWTIIETKKKDEIGYRQERFKQNEKFISMITISSFAGKQIEICKATWPPAKEKTRIKWITGGIAGIGFWVFFLK